jgi:hypothetical protein
MRCLALKSCSWVFFGLVPFATLTLTWPILLFANESSTAHYRSAVDESLLVKKIAIAPVVDNMQGIYGAPVEEELRRLIQENHHWDLIEINPVGTSLSPEDFENDPEKVMSFLQSSEADSLMAAKVMKGPQGVTLHLNLFNGKDGLLLAKEEASGKEPSDIPTVKSMLRNLFSHVMGRIPYHGLVLSRRDQRVTVDLGAEDGVQANQIIEAVQIFSVNRHPKFKFIISSEKEIIGKIKLHKVEKTLSFGSIISEKEKGAIQRYAKISGIRPVQYSGVNPYNTGSVYQRGVEHRQDNLTAFGKDPQEWVPEKKPAFGKIGLALGVGNYSGNLTLTSAGPLENTAVFYPNFSLSGELWLTPQWILDVRLKQSILATSNPLAGSTPGTLAHAITQSSLRLGYNFLLTNDFFGPKIEFLFGFGSYRHYVDDSSPRALTTMAYGGLIGGIRGSFPLLEQQSWSLGAELNFYLSPSLNETPVTSGAGSNNTINSFSFWVENQLAHNLRGFVALDFDLYTTSFSGTGTRTDSATSASHKSNIIFAGINYLF